MRPKKHLPKISRKEKSLLNEQENVAIVQQVFAALQQGDR